MGISSAGTIRTDWKFLQDLILFYLGKVELHTTQSYNLSFGYPSLIQVIQSNKGRQSI